MTDLIPAENKSELFSALALAQGQFKPVETDKKVSFPTKGGSQVKYNYASFAAIVQMAQKPLSENGLSILQYTENGNLVTMLAHASGQYILSFIPLPDSNDIKQLGANLSYLRRYQYTSLVGIVIKEEDNEAVVGGSLKPPTKSVVNQSTGEVISPNQAAGFDTNGNLTTKPAEKEFTFPSGAAKDFFVIMEKVTDNYWQGNGWHFSRTLERLNLNWSLLNNRDDMEKATQKLKQHASNRRDEKAAANG